MRQAVECDRKAKSRGHSFKTTRSICRANDCDKISHHVYSFTIKVPPKYLAYDGSLKFGENIDPFVKYHRQAAFKKMKYNVKYGIGFTHSALLTPLTRSNTRTTCCG
jgi:hypothetical protein